MDPLGFAFENFDAVGRWRSEEDGTPVDASGVMPGGAKFAGPADFRRALLENQGALITTVAEKLLTYALGRGVEFQDMPAVRAIVAAAEQGGSRWSSLVLAIVRS